MRISLPSGALVLLIGPSGSGKSTFAHRHFQPTQILSSDTCRAWISDDESDQSATKDAFQLLGEILEMRLRRGRLTIVDATNVQSWARASLLKIAKEHDRPAVAVVFDLPAATVTAQNQSRARNVDAGVVNQQARDLQTTLEELPQEGFAAVYILRSQAEVNDVEIRLEN